MELDSRKIPRISVVKNKFIIYEIDSRNVSQMEFDSRKIPLINAVQNKFIIYGIDSRNVSPMELHSRNASLGEQISFAKSFAIRFFDSRDSWRMELFPFAKESANEIWFATPVANRIWFAKPFANQFRILRSPANPFPIILSIHSQQLRIQLTPRYSPMSCKKQNSSNKNHSNRFVHPFSILCTPIILSECIV